MAILTRYPEPGDTKTRLIPALGAQGAAELHYRMLEHVLHSADVLRETRDVEVRIFHSGGSQQAFRALLGPELCYVEQSGQSLGERMENAFQLMFEQGCAKAVLIGSDCPGLKGSILEEAFQALDTSDVVFGPALDGGYYLLGLTRPVPGLFRNIPWGTGDVLDLSLRQARQSNLSVHLLETLRDVDEAEDLEAFHSCGAELISVIIPALNEAHCIQAAIRNAGAEENAEIIVVDGGSGDETRSIAEREGARVLTASGGRSGQQNQGAAAARGAILLFLHADSVLPANYGKAVRELFRDPNAALGAFSLHIQGSSSLLHLIEQGANLRSRLLQLPYGDQALFLRRRVFRALGGFAQMRIMEDFDLVRRARKKGRIKTLQPRVTTSARRWRARGIFRTTLLNQLMILGYCLRLSTKRLASLYGRRGGG